MPTPEQLPRLQRLVKADRAAREAALAAAAAPVDVERAAVVATDKVRLTKTQAAQKRAAAEKKAGMPPLKDRAPSAKVLAARKAKRSRAAKKATATRKINDAKREVNRQTTTMRRTRRQVGRVVEAVTEGTLVPEAPQILPDPTRPLDVGPGQLIAGKLARIGARLRDGSLRGERDPDTGRSVLPPAVMTTLPGVQAISLAIRFLPGGRDRFEEYVQLGALNCDETCLRFWQVWAELTPAERAIASYDDVALAAGVRPADLISKLVLHAMNMGLDAGRLVAAAAHPQVLDAMIQSAMKPESVIGQTDRLEFLRAQGFLPIPQKGPMVAISANATAAAGAMAASLPSNDPSVLSPFGLALRAAQDAQSAVIEGVIVESDQRREEERLERKALAAAPAAIDPFKAAMAAGVDAREADRGTVIAAVLGQTG